MEANTRVRLVGDTTRIGLTTGKTRIQRNRLLIQVQFADLPRYIPEDQIELVPLDRESPIDLLEKCKFGKTVDLRRTITHVRLTGRLADVIYSMEATNTDFYAYQFKPVLKLLHSPSNGILIADEVGLGKTIEAGLIWTELRSRFDMRRLLVLCPAVLREKWRDELYSKMGVKAELADAKEALRVLKDPDSASRGFALVCSMQGLRPERGWAKKEDGKSAALKLAKFLVEKENEDHLIDLLVVDEAHYMRNQETSTNDLGEIFRNVSEYAAFLTATPVHNKNKDLFSVLRLLDPDTFRTSEDFTAILNANLPLVQARENVLSHNFSPTRVKELLAAAKSHWILEDNRQLESLINLVEQGGLEDAEVRSRVAYRLETVNLLGHVVTRTRKRDVKEWRVIRDAIPESISMEPVEEEFYQRVTELVMQYSLENDINHHFLLATPQRMITSSMPAALKSWQKRRGALDQIDPYDLQEEGHNNSGIGDLLGPLTYQLVQEAEKFADIDELVEADSKYRRLKEVLQTYLKEHPEEKIVLFSTFRATLDYLSERLNEDDISNVVLKGGGAESKDEIIKHFRSSNGPSVLLSSEVGGEGVDLQFSRVVVNYDLPWNPMRIEQRIGRIDRLGQEADKILIWNLFYDGTIDARVYRRLYDKLNLCQQALGDFEAVLGDEIRKLTVDLLTGRLSPKQQERRIDQTAQALENLKLEEEQLEMNASQLIAYGDYILSQVQAARDLNRWITGEDLRAYALDFMRLHYPGCVFKQLDGDKGLYDIQLSHQAKHDLMEFMRHERLSQHTWLIQNSSKPVRCLFENRVSGGSDGRAEIVSQFHPLVRFAGSLINEREEQLRPAVAIQIMKQDIDNLIDIGCYVVCASLWSVKGLQTTEKLVFKAKGLASTGKILTDGEAEQLAIGAAMSGNDWLEAKSSINVELAYEIANEDLFGGLYESYEEFVDEIRAQNEDRVELQRSNLHKHLVNQTKKLNDILWGHKSAGRNSLVKATEGRIRALEDRIERQTLAIMEKSQTIDSYEEIFVAIINVV